MKVWIYLYKHSRCLFNLIERSWADVISECRFYILASLRHKCNIQFPCSYPMIGKSLSNSQLSKNRCTQSRKKSHEQSNDTNLPPFANFWFGFHAYLAFYILWQSRQYAILNRAISTVYSISFMVVVTK